ncbi:MAG: TonB-dependent receptor [Pseudomonadota bacterium]
MSKNAKWHFGAASALALSTAIVIAPTSAAQDDDDAVDARRLNTVTVSATKRDETLQDVPVSVGAVPAEVIAKVGANDIADLTVYIPNFELNNSTVLPNLYVRGLGSGATHSIEQSVGRFVDEVYIGRAAMNLHKLFDVSGVEVLRGPQGTLFGKNTVAGALIVRTANPTNDFDAGVTLTHGVYSTTGGYNSVQGFVSGPLMEGVRGRLAANFGTDDGFYINRLADSGPSGPEREDQDIRLKLEWDATPNTLVSVKLENSQFDEYGADAAEMIVVGGPPGALAGILAASPGFNTDLDWVIDVDCTDILFDLDGNGTIDGSPIQQGGENFGDFCALRDQETTTGAFRVDHEFESGTLTWLSAYQEYSFDHQFFGIDMGATNAFRATRLEDYEGMSHEVRYTSDLINDKLDFIVGAFYEDSDLSRNQFSDVQFFTLGLGPIALRRNEPWTQSTETLAIFGQVRYDLTDQIRVIAGGRYADESKDFVFDRFFNNYGDPNTPYPATSPLGPFDPPISNIVGSRNETKFTPALTIQYRPSDSVNLYATYAQGHKTGGFSDRIENATADFEFDAETNDTFELGAKNQWFDGALSTNITLFHMEIEGQQLATQIPGAVPSFSVDNAAQTTSQGVEFDAQWLVNEDWTLGMDFAYTDATYDDFTGTPDCPASAVVNGECNLAGFPTIFAPETKGTVYAEYFNPQQFGEWGFGARVDVNYSGEYFTDISYLPGTFEDGYTLVNGSLRLISPDERYTLSLIGKNLGDEAVLAWGIPSGPNVLAAMRRPQEIAVKLSARY